MSKANSPSFSTSNPKSLQDKEDQLRCRRGEKACWDSYGKQNNCFKSEGRGIELGSLLKLQHCFVEILIAQVHPSLTLTPTMLELKCIMECKSQGHRKASCRNSAKPDVFVMPLAHLSYSSYVCWTTASATRVQRLLSVGASISPLPFSPLYPFLPFSLLFAFPFPSLLPYFFFSCPTSPTLVE